MFDPDPELVPRDKKASETPPVSHEVWMAAMTLLHEINILYAIIPTSSTTQACKRAADNLRKLL